MPQPTLLDGQRAEWGFGTIAGELSCPLLLAPGTGTAVVAICLCKRPRVQRVLLEPGNRQRRKVWAVMLAGIAGVGVGKGWDRCCGVGKGWDSSWKVGMG